MPDAMLTALIVVISLLNVAILGVGIYLTAYLKKKAQNLATREEFKELQRQTAELTRTTAQIETDIRGGLWDRQKRWELKRDVLFEIVKNLGATFDALNSVWACHALPEDPAKKGQLDYELMRSESKAKAVMAWSATSKSYDISLGLVAITCSRELTHALREMMIFMRTLEKNVQENPSLYKESLVEYSAKASAIDALLRRELGIDHVPQPSIQ